MGKTVIGDFSVSHQRHISQVLILNTLCCLIAALLAWNAAWLIRYWPVITGAWFDFWRLFQ
jgi:hypothetical protein